MATQLWLKGGEDPLKQRETLVIFQDPGLIGLTGGGEGNVLFDLMS